MEKTKELQIKKDLPNRKLTITRYFDAGPDTIWRAWTEQKFLEQWWAPEPWRAETSDMDFKVGGRWLYAMVGPNGERHYSHVDYTAIEENKSFEAVDGFCDADGNEIDSLPKMNWLTEFEKDGSGTKLVVNITFNKDEDMKQLLEMGFEEGFTMTLAQLDYKLNEKIIKI